MKQNEIKRKQNEEFLLKCQFTARHYYNKAELTNYFIWILCIASALTIFIPDTNNWILLGLPLLLDAICFLFEKSLENSVATAASLRNYFDAYVLDINKAKYSDADVRKIKEIVHKTVSQYPEECAVQIQHTGSNNPPGVRDWYEFSHNFSDADIQHECQRQNCWWNKEVSKRRIKVYSFISVILIIIIVLIWQHLNAGDPLLRIALCSGILFKAIEQISVGLKYYHQSLKIDGALEILNECKSKKNILVLQTMIEARREIPILEINAVHKRIAKKLTERYRAFS